jgi:AcrR family transcriptional regulator
LTAPGSSGDEAQPGSSAARERILRTAYVLFWRYGVNPVGVDRIVAESGVAKTTLYRHFHSKDDLVVAVLDRHRAVWTRGWLRPQIDGRGTTAEERLLAVFDAFDDWFHEDGYGGCLFTNTLVETHERSGPISAAAIAGLAEIRALLRELAAEAGAHDPDDLAEQMQMLMFGAIIAALTGRVDAARRARATAQLLLERERVGARAPRA